MSIKMARGGATGLEKRVDTDTNKLNLAPGNADQHHITEKGQKLNIRVSALEPARL